MTMQSTASASSLRLNTLPFFSAYPSSSSQTRALYIPFSHPLRSRKIRNQDGDQKSARNYSVKGLKSIYSGEILEPMRSSKQGIWSYRDDLRIPSSPYFSDNVHALSPSLAVQEGLQTVVGKLFQHRIVRCGGPIDDAMANFIVAQLLYLDAVDPNKDVVMYVNSPGGSVTAGMAIFDMMRHIRPDVSTVCVGLAASMGAFLLGAGTKGKRFSLPDSRIMIHQPLGGAQGFQTQINIQVDELLYHKANLTGYLALFSGRSLDQVYRETNKDNFMSAKEAKEYGLIDGVIKNPVKAFPPLAASAAGADP